MREHPHSKPGFFVGAIMLAALSASAQTPDLPNPVPTMIKKPKGVADEAEKAVNVRLIAEGTALVPGRASTIGVSFDIAPGWNLYWRNPGDSGLPISIKIEAPEGVTVGEAQWPTPERHVLPGDLLDYVYMRRVTLLFPITVGPSLSRSAESVTIKASVKWLVCKEACVPGSREVEMTMPIATGSSPSADAELIAAARARLPRTAAEQSSPIVGVVWRGRTLRLSCTGAEELVFFPYEGDAQPDEALKNGRSTRESLTLSYAKADPGAPVLGVLQVMRLGKTSYHLVEAPPVPPKE